MDLDLTQAVRLFRDFPASLSVQPSQVVRQGREDSQSRSRVEAQELEEGRQGHSDPAGQALHLPRLLHRTLAHQEVPEYLLLL